MLGLRERANVLMQSAPGMIDGEIRFVLMVYRCQPSCLDQSRCSNKHLYITRELSG